MHLTQKEVEDYFRQNLSTAELLTVSAHLGECESCRRELEGSVNGDLAFFALRSEVFGEAGEALSAAAGPAHVTESELAGYIDGTLSTDDRQMVADHLIACERCTLAIDDLSIFKGELAASIDREYHPAAIVSPDESVWRRVFAVLIRPFRLPPVPVFSAVLAILLLMVTGWFVWRARRSER